MLDRLEKLRISKELAQISAPRDDREEKHHLDEQHRRRQALHSQLTTTTHNGVATGKTRHGYASASPPTSH